jgi:hypothetical protein
MNQIYLKPHPEINQVKRRKVKSQWLQKKRLQWEWWLARMVKGYSLTVAFWGARRIEKLLQNFEQEKSNLNYAHEWEKFHYMKGFCDGLKYCIDGKWHEDQDRTFLAFWRDTRLG